MLQPLDRVVLIKNELLARVKKDSEPPVLMLVNPPANFPFYDFVCVVTRVLRDCSEGVQFGRL